MSELIQAAIHKLVDRLGLQDRCIDVRADEKIIVAKGGLKQARIYLERSEPDPGDSGWYVGPVDGPQLIDKDNPEHYEAIWIWQLNQMRPNLFPALCLPPGFIVVFQGDTIVGIANEMNEEVWREEA